MPEKGTLAISLLVQMKAGHRSQVPATAGYGKDTWIKVGKLKLQPVDAQYKVADGNPLQVSGHSEVTVEA